MVHVSFALLLVALLVSSAYWGLRIGLLWSYLLAINVATIAFYGHDKRRAGTSGRRVPEKVLHALAFAGGTPGAFVAQKLFRHKTIKGEFRRVFWVICILQLLLIAWWVYANRR